MATVLGVSGSANPKYGRAVVKTFFITLSSKKSEYPAPELRRRFLTYWNGRDVQMISSSVLFVTKVVYPVSAIDPVTAKGAVRSFCSHLASLMYITSSLQPRQCLSNTGNFFGCF